MFTLSHYKDIIRGDAMISFEHRNSLGIGNDLQALISVKHV